MALLGQQHPTLILGQHGQHAESLALVAERQI